MKKILVFGAGSDLIFELIRMISLSDKDLSFTFISSNLSNKKKYSFLKCKTEFLIIDYNDNFENKVSSFLENEKYDEIYIPNEYLPSSNSSSETNRSLLINYLVPIRIINLIVHHYKGQGTRIISFSSPAADRPRKSNFVYGSHKALLEFTIKGLRLNYPNISFVIVKPGPTKTKMTKNYLGFKHNKSTVLKSLFLQLNLGFENIYAPFYWRLIMTVIILIPNRIFKYLKF